MRSQSLADAYVTARLREWGREFMLDSFDEPHEHTLLYLLIKFGGEIPRLEGGRAPEAVNEQAWQIERLVALMHTERPVEASVLRAYYGGRDRHRVERREAAELLAGCKIGVREYYTAHDRGFAWICGALH